MTTPIAGREQPLKEEQNVSAEQVAASARRCTVAQDNLAYGLIRCDRFAGHEGQHESVAYDLAWGPQEPTGKWVGDRWVRHATA